MHPLLTCLLVVAGRVADVTLGTLRTISVVRGRRCLAAALGFTEVFIWIFVVAQVVQGLHENVLLGVSYALGFALGNFLGVTVDEWLAHGEQVLLIISRKGGELARALRDQGLRLTEVEAQGRDGPTRILLVVLPRRQAGELKSEIERLDPDCFYTVDDLRASSSLSVRMQQLSGWQSVLKRK